MPEYPECKALETIIQREIPSRGNSYALEVTPIMAGANKLHGVYDFLATQPSNPAIVTLIKPSVQSFGKQILIQLSATFLMILHFSLHGHLVPLSNEETLYVRICRAQGFPPICPILFASINPHYKSFAVVDRNRLVNIVLQAGTLDTYLSPSRGPCPYRTPALFIQAMKNFGRDRGVNGTGALRPVYETITTHQDTFNGYGACTTNELLFWACIHPLTPTHRIFPMMGPINNYFGTDPRDNLIAAHQRLFAIFTADSYARFVTNAGIHGTGFQWPQSTTAYRMKITKVYRHTGGRGLRAGKTFVPTDIVARLRQQGQIPPRLIPASKIGRALRINTEGEWLPVHAYRYRTTLNADWIYVYTVIQTPPPPPEQLGIAVWQLLPWNSLQYQRKQLKIMSLNPKIGVASFFDTEALAYIERHYFKRRWPVYTGHPGRPFQSKMVFSETHGIPPILRASLERIPLNLLPARYRTADVLAYLPLFRAAWLADHMQGQAELEDERGELQQEAIDQQVCGELQQEAIDQQVYPP